MSQEVMENIIYGDVAGDVSTFNGLATRYNHLIDPETGVAPANAVNILDAGGTGTDNTSIYIVQWGREKLTCSIRKVRKRVLIFRTKGNKRYLMRKAAVMKQCEHTSNGTWVYLYVTGARLFVSQTLMFRTFQKTHLLVQILLIYWTKHFLSYHLQVQHVQQST